MPDLPHSLELLTADQSRLLIIDMQEKLLPVIDGHAVIHRNCLRLIHGAQILSMPVSTTEQYPQGLGPTVPELAALLSDRVEKITFSALNSLAWAGSGLEPDGRFRIVIAGIEAHVCVLQTVFDLLAHGFRVYVAADAVGSRRTLDRDIALRRMESGGAVITTVESILFEWCERAGTSGFKQISRLIREL